MNIKNTVLITLALGLALSTNINLCIEVEEPTEQQDNSYFQWRSRAAALRKRMFGESPYPGAALAGAGITATIATGVNLLVSAARAISLQHLQGTHYLSNTATMRLAVNFAKQAALPAAIGGAIIGAIVAMDAEYTDAMKPELLAKANEKVKGMMPLVISGLEKRLTNAREINELTENHFEAYEKSNYKNLYKIIWETENALNQ